MRKKGKYQSKDVYLNAALEIINEAGVSKLTMRKVATHLDVSPMAIYKHFPNKQALLRATLDEFIARADVMPPDELCWDDWVQHMAQGMYRALCGETSWLPLLGAIDVGPNALRVTSGFINKMTAAGLSVGEAIEAYLAIVHTVIGAVTLQTALEHRDSGLVESIGALAGGGKDDYVIAGILSNNQLDISLPYVIDGLRKRLG